MSGYTCRWCGLASPADGLLSCPHCGAPVDVRELVSDSGWVELPPIKDMAHIQCGRSTCQIEGAYVPVADFNLTAPDSVYFAHHQLLWKDPSVTIGTMSLRKGWKRLFAGLPLVMAQARGPGHIAFSRDAPGEMVALPLQPGMAMDVREHIFMVATTDVGYDWFATNVWFKTQNGDETETHYPVGMFMDRFTAGGSPGLLLLHAAGNVFMRSLAPGESILLKPTALLCKDPTVSMQLHFERPARSGWSPWTTWNQAYTWLSLVGPGRVMVHSAYDPLHARGRITGWSRATVQQW
jgi:uncharacterized protein (AIM24 family)